MWAKSESIGGMPKKTKDSAKQNTAWPVWGASKTIPKDHRLSCCRAKGAAGADTKTKGGLKVREETCCELALSSWPDQAVLCPSFDPVALKTYKSTCSNCQHEIVVLVLEERDEVKP